MANKEPCIEVEQSTGSRFNSIPENNIGSAVCTQSVMAGKPSSGLVNLGILRSQQCSSIIPNTYPVHIQYIPSTYPVSSIVLEKNQNNNLFTIQRLQASDGQFHTLILHRRVQVLGKCEIVKPRDYGTWEPQTKPRQERQHLHEICLGFLLRNLANSFVEIRHVSKLGIVTVPGIYVLAAQGHITLTQKLLHQRSGMRTIIVFILVLEATNVSIELLRGCISICRNVSFM